MSKAIDFSGIKCLTSSCKENNVIMKGDGAQLGGRVEAFYYRCSQCGLKLAIVPLKPEYEYQIKATTKQERKEQRIKEARERHELALAEEINKIESSKN